MVQYRQNPLSNNQIYHVYTRSIAKYVVFNDAQEYERMMQLLNLHRYINFNYRYSEFLKLTPENQITVLNNLVNSDLMVDIISYCLMPTHIHLIIRQNTDDGIARYMARVLNSYSRYFNTKHQRIGPLWSGRFKNVLVDNDEQLLHLTRYLHLNPTSANLVNKPQDWNYSSYLEYK